MFEGLISCLRHFKHGNHAPNEIDYAFLTNSDLRAIEPNPSILQSML